MLSRTAGSAGLPWTLLLVATFAVLVAFGVAPRDVIVFGAYITLILAVPGMLWVRLLRSRSGELAEDLALGLVLGYVIEIALHLLGGVTNSPPLGLPFAAVTIGLFAIHPRLRGFWRSAAPAPAWWSWSLAVVLAIVMAYSARDVFASHPLSGSVAYVDMHYHLALIGELRHHVPPTIPYVVDTPLAYHWFFYAESAATSQATGIEPIVLLYRLSGIPMFAAAVVLTATGALRITERWMTPLAVAIALFATAPSPYSWTSRPIFDSQTLGTTWISPTNLLGLAFITAGMVVLMDVVGAGARAGGRAWVLVAALTFGAAGVKSTLLPLLAGGLVVMLALQAITSHRVHRPGVIATGIVGTAFVLSMILVYGGATGGLELGFESLRWFGVAFPALGIPQLVVFAPIATLVVALILWSFMWAGAFGLAARGRRVLGDPAIGLLLGICLAALGAVTLLIFPGLSQLYFIRGAAPAFGILTAAGVAALIPAGTRAWVLGSTIGIAVVAGAATVLGGSAIAPVIPEPASLDLYTYGLSVLLPVTVLVLCTAAVLLVLRLGARRWQPLRRLVPLLMVCYIMAFGIPSTVARLAVQTAYPTSNIAEVSADGVAAARWLRAHSPASDLVATNLHCVAQRGGRCDARHFWLSAFAERRVLVEGWAYTQRAIDISLEIETNPRYVPFWNQNLLALNDRAITSPTAKNLSALADRYHVRWLFVARPGADLTSLDRLAHRRHAVGDYVIYELVRANAG